MREPIESMEICVFRTPTGREYISFGPFEEDDPDNPSEEDVLLQTITLPKEVTVTGRSRDLSDYNRMCPLEAFRSLLGLATALGDDRLIAFLEYLLTRVWVTSRNRYLPPVKEKDE